MRNFLLSLCMVLLLVGSAYAIPICPQPQEKCVCDDCELLETYNFHCNTKVDEIEDFLDAWTEDFCVAIKYSPRRFHRYTRYSCDIIHDAETWGEYSFDPCKYYNVKIYTCGPGTHGDPVPEPATILLFGCGLLALTFWRKKNV